MDNATRDQAMDRLESLNDSLEAINKEIEILEHDRNDAEREINQVLSQFPENQTLPSWIRLCAG